MEEPIDIYQIKMCSKCGEPKPLEQFHITTTTYVTKDGRTHRSKNWYSYCRKCNSDNVTKHREINPKYAEKSKKASKKAWKENGDRYVYERRAKENIGRAFKRRPKPILGYTLSKSEDGLWRFIKN